jgi:predicted acyl esterase
MTLRTLLITTLMVLVPLAGCFGSSDDDGPSALGADAAPVPLDAVVADGAEKSAYGDGVRLVWAGQLMGSQAHEIQIPPQAVLARATLETPGGVGFRLSDEATGLTRCPIVGPLNGNGPRAGETTCAELTVLDTQDGRTATWNLALSGPAETAAAFTFTLDLLPGPLVGPAAAIDLSALSTPDLEIAPMRTDHVESSADGSRIFVEIHTPVGDGPWPTILISSPYNQPTREAGGIPQGTRVTHWVPRGYAVVSADVRGFAQSEGCAEVWGPNEQQDQYDLVEWVAQQDWSDGMVGMYGQSYVGTTPHEAAVLKPPHLVTIATVAGLTDPYFDWHFGGVPNGESALSPAAYSVLTAPNPPPASRPETIPDWAMLARQDGCGLAEMLAEANDPNAVHGAFYDVRNFSAKAGQIEVPVLYTQGYIDGNVKSRMAVDFFNDIQTPKLGFFGPWLHRHPPRADFELVLHAWMDHWLQDRPTNVLAVPAAQAVTNVDTLRYADEWPPEATSTTPFYLDASAGALAHEPPASAATFAYQAGPGALNSALEDSHLLVESEALTKRVYITGEIHVEFTARVVGSTNTHFGAVLLDVAPDGTVVEVGFGMLNAGLRESYDRFEPVPAAEDVRYRLPFLPTEYVVEEGHTLQLVLGPSTSAFSALGPHQVTILAGTGDDAAVLQLPTMDDPGDLEAPMSVFGGLDAFRSTP